MMGGGGGGVGEGELFLGESIITSLFDLTWLVLVVGTPHHELKAGFWVSLLEISLEEYFLWL